ncbi:tetratricopeptide repeat protein [Bradyrhizobium sp. LHD-71]|uniref:tetratricopeptide repeat protein n=1 Tax=Bradyrhizobium sp. LHD-71 TaxID=3072141 RepID=UPI00280CF78C|nr:tetratricopeptide repeat protein [Bradyrhizobium sp. LHD-71]MDQ8727941.1 tetratricopeptide repeat protein [Bradyrhizobium sp. LHD-71]
MKGFSTIVAAAFVLAAPLSTDNARAVAQTPAAVVKDSYDALFQQMFQNPSNLEVSFKFAELAAVRGDYEAAIGALERMLFFNPNLPRVKLELGVLYFKLGSWDLARSYLQDAIKGSDVPNDIRAQVNAYLAEIARRQAPYEFAVFAHAGARWQSNANIGPDGLIVRAIGQDAILNDKFARAPDWNWFQVAAMHYIHKINKRGDAFEVVFTGYASQQHRFTQFDLGIVEATAGPRIAIDQKASFKIYGIGTGVMLAHHKYIESGGAGFSIRGPLGSFGLAEGYIEHRHRRFFDSDEFPTASEQTGNLTTAAINAELRFGVVRLTTRVGFDRNNARFDYNSYDRWSADVGLPMEFSVPGFDGAPRQVVVTPTAGYSDTRYDEPNWIVDPFVFRKDREARVGGIIDVQLYQNYGLRTTITHTWIDSNLPNYDLKNFTVAFGPTARF